MSRVQGNSRTRVMEASSAESRAADQARIRKERREAKIRAGASARLDKITGLGGGIKKGISDNHPSVK